MKTQSRKFIFIIHFNNKSNTYWAESIDENVGIDHQVDMNEITIECQDVLDGFIEYHPDYQPRSIDQLPEELKKRMTNLNDVVAYLYLTPIQDKKS